MAPTTWQRAADKKRDELFSQVPRHWKLNNLPQTSDSFEAVRSNLSPGELQVTEKPAHEILDALRTGTFTATEVLSAFCHRAVLAHQLTCCLSELQFMVALARARELDQFWNTHHTTIGPLHGLPISLMDRFHVRGLDSTCGFTSWANSKKTIDDEGTLVKNLRDLGAIVFCKTNVPMSMMMGETANNIVGTTTSPWDRNLSAGGACGGEGVLVALKGSPFGIGTDVAGSSRIPSAFNGLFALKCSERRLSYSGVATVLRGLPISNGVIGMMSNHAMCLTQVFQGLLSAKPWLTDMDVLELPWRQEKLDAIRRRTHQKHGVPGRLVFGILATDGHVQPHSPVSRAISLVTTALQNCGYETVKWDPPPHAPAVENLFRIFGSTSAAEARAALDQSGEPPVTQLKDWYETGDVEASSSAEFWDLCDQQERYRTQYAAYWRSMSSKTISGRVPDGVILPATPHTATRHGKFHYFGYSAIANALDYPAAVFPVTVGDADLDKVSVASKPALSEVDAQVQQTFNINDLHGMPVGLQVMCPRLQEEQVLGLTEAISDALISQVSTILP